MNRIDKDMLAIANGEEVAPDLQRLMDQLQEYVGKKEVTSAKELVSVMLLVSSILDVPEETWYKTINRLNNIMLYNETGLTTGDIMKMVKMTGPSNGPIN